MSHFRPYPEYADTQSRFIDTIPTHWELRRLSTLGRLFKGVGGNKQDDTDSGLPCVRYGQLYTVHRYHIRAIDTYIDETRRQAYMPIRHGDLLLAASGETLDEIGKSAVNLLATDTVCGGDIIVFRPSDELDQTYLGYVADSLPSIGQKALMGKGFTVIHIYGDQLKNLELPLPAKPEQQRIGHYLDQALPRIDTLIEKKTRFIELLKEKRRALITHAVTKGLNPDAPMKDSGIEWLGEVPAHWEIRRSKTLFQQRKEKASGSDEQMTASQSHGVIYQKDYMQIENQKVVQVQIGHDILKHVEPDDFVISMRSFQGGIELSRFRGSVSSAYVVLKPRSIVNVEYFRFALKSSSYIQALQSTSDLVRDGQALRFQNFVKVDLPLPPPKDQAAIADFLTGELSRIDSLVDKTTLSIALLRERHSTLITAAVTGKIDLRDAA